MKYTIQDDSNRLVITVDEDERKELQELKDEDDLFGTDGAMYDFFEQMVCNSELQWIDPSITGDLTEAPMLAILGPDEPGPVDAGNGDGLMNVGCTGEECMYQPVLFRWAYMDYQIKSPLQDLLDNGSCVFVGGKLLERD